MSATALLNERQTTHGSFASNAHYGQTLRLLFRSSPHWDRMPAEHREALDMMACKLSRILSGQSTFADHWKDISGYAELAEGANLSYDDRQQAELRNCTGCGGRWHMHHDKCAECRAKEAEEVKPGLYRSTAPSTSIFARSAAGELHDPPAFPSLKKEG